MSGRWMASWSSKITPEYLNLRENKLSKGPVTGVNCGTMSSQSCITTQIPVPYWISAGLRSILITPSANPVLDGSFEDETILSSPALHSIITYIYGSRGSPGPASNLDLPPQPPTSERPGYPVLYTTTNTLDDDILLGIFNHYRLDDENAWNVRLGWCKLSHVCRRWRYLVHSSAFHLGIQILCTNGTPTVDTLDHLPPLPLLIVYRVTIATISEKDELGIYHALRLRGRIRTIDLDLPPWILHKFLMLMDEPFPTLERLSLSFTVDKTTTLTLPSTFLAPNLRHLKLLGIRLPKGLPLLSSVSLVSLTLTNIRASGYFLPGQLVARLRSLPQLEELSIGFSIPIPRPSAERELLGKQETPITLLNLKHLTFRGVSGYLECLVAQIRAPLLERLNITLFGQIAFALPHLSYFTSSIESLKLPTAKVFFWRDRVFIIMDHHSNTRLHGHDGSFVLRLLCKQLDWQIDCAAQICGALMPTLSGVEKLTLDFYGLMVPVEWQNGGIDGTTWHELLRSFIRVKELHICSALLQELSRALQVDEVGSDPGFLPGLQELVSEFKGKHAEDPFSPFIHARRVGGRPVRLVRQQFPEFTTTQIVAAPT
ncbi:hypothetical protein BJY52DRAFT_1187454 [Lactarius psammicola]|nr:hypothetical protein BJY52DRAFT_1187454 [Lactarius psammicola]